MKFGDSLRQRSTSWQLYNVDYDDIKTYIKHISQHSGSAPERKAMEDHLLEVLLGELDKVDNFVRSKAGEIERRLGAVDAMVDQFANSSNAESGSLKTVSKRNVQRMDETDAEIKQCIQDVATLSRFVSAQQTGFRKLIKKYERWCNLDPNLSSSSSANSSSRKLRRHFEKALHDRYPFYRRLDFNYILYRLSNLYETFRVTDKNYSSDDLALSPSTQTASQEDRIMVFWINHEDVMEVEFNLLKELALKPAKSSSVTATTKPSDLIQRTSTTYFDTPEHNCYLAARQNGQTHPSIILLASDKDNEAVIRWESDGGGTKLLKLLKKAAILAFKGSLSDDDIIQMQNSVISNSMGVDEAHATIIDLQSSLNHFKLAPGNDFYFILVHADPH